jgi:hypothetical protein
VTGYLGDILEDLGHPLTGELSSATTLLKLPAKTFRWNIVLLEKINFEGN